MVYTDYIAQILEQVEQNPAQARRNLRAAWEKTSADEFRLAAVPLLTTGEGPGQRFLVSFLLQNDNLERNLTDHRKFAKEEAVAVARAAHRVEPSLDVKLAMQLASRAVEDDRDAGRILEILEAVSQPANLLPLMGGILQHPAAKVRSKAVLLMGKGNRNPAWVKAQLREPDERVRANAVESLWGLDGEEVCQVFLEASRDRHQRTSVNGMLGLHFCGRTESLQLLADAAQNRSASLRASAAWGMGRTRDLRFLPLLTKLVRDPEALVRSNALKAIAKIRDYRTLVTRQGSYRVWLGHVVHGAGGARHIAGVTRGPVGPVLGPLNFAIEEAGRPVFGYELTCYPDQDSAIGVALPHPSDIEETLAGALNRAFAEALAEKRALQCFATAAYSNVEGAARPAACAYSNAAASIGKAREAALAASFGGFVPALSALFQPMPGFQQRALVAVGSPMSESADMVLRRQEQLGRLAAQARASQVKIITIAPPVCAPIMRVSLHNAAAETGGRFLETTSEEACGRALASVMISLFPSFELRYSLPEPPAGKLRLLVYSAAGFGETEGEFAERAMGSRA